MAFEFHDEGIRFLREQPFAMLGDEPGLGKTRQLLMAAESPTLVVAPAMILDSGVWDTEVDKWTPDLDVTTVSYASVCAREKTAKGGTRPLPIPRPEYKREWASLILDEAHKVKGRDTTWTRALKKVAKRAGSVHLATGTPIPNWAHELFVPLQLMYPDDAKPGNRLGSFWRWAEEWFTIESNPWDLHARDVGGLRPDRTWAEFHDANLGDRFLQRLRDEVLTDLPPMTDQTVPVSMGAKQARAYREIKRDFITWLESGEQVTAWSKAGQLVRLAKVATGLESVAPESGDRGSAKLDRFREILTDRVRPVLAVTHFRSSAYAALMAARDAGRTAVMLDGTTPRGQRREIVQGFQSGKYDCLIGTIGVVSEGLTLTAADTCVLIEHSWLPSKNEQVIRRIHRIGQTRPVSVLRLITRNTIDERVQELLAAKSDQQMRALRPHAFADVA